MSYKKSSDFGICFLFGSGKVFCKKGTMWLNTLCIQLQNMLVQKKYTPWSCEPTWTSSVETSVQKIHVKCMI